MMEDTTTFDVGYQFLPGVRTHSFLLVILGSEHPLRDSGFSVCIAGFPQFCPLVVPSRGLQNLTVKV